MKNIKILNVLPECYVDTNLIEYLLNAGVNHQHSCTKVIGQLKTTFRDNFAIGIIDRDRVEMGYIYECDNVAHTNHLTLFKHKQLPQYLITIEPAIDKFILDVVKEQCVNIEQFGLPSEFKAFIKISKSVTSNTDSRFKRLFAELNENAEINALRNALRYLLDTRYNADLTQLQKILMSR